MARPLRIQFPGALYHITSRGNARQAIFMDDQDRDRFLDALSMVVERFNWLCHAYCLMENHYHLLIETPDGNLSNGMRELNGVYTQGFNQKYQRVGHLFQGRYKGILVGKDSHLLSLCRYVVLNPVAVGLVKSPEQWEWSSYGATIGLAKKPSFLTIDWLLSRFGGTKKLAMEKYKRFVMEGIGKESVWETLKGQVFLGTDEFIKQLGGLLDEKGDTKEVPKRQRYAARPSLSDLFQEKGLTGRKGKDQKIYAAHVHHGYTMKEISEYLKVHYATISRAIKRVEEGARQNV